MEMEPLHKNIFGKIVGFISSAALFRVQGAVGGLDLEVVIAVDPGDLLDDVRLDGHILGGTPGGHFHVEQAAVEARRRSPGPGAFPGSGRC